MLNIRLAGAVVWLGLAAAAGAQAAQTFLRDTSFEQRPAIVLTNDKLELTVTLTGGAFARLTRRDDSEQLNPLWEPARAAREAGEKPRFGASLGHFLCVDGFGSPSAEERAAGFPGHGEAHLLPWEIQSSGKEGSIATVRLGVRLPLAQEAFTRTIRMADGEQVVYVESELESLTAFDRPLAWAEHVTIGAPFLEPSLTVVDISGRRAMTRPYGPGGERVRRLASGKEFTWPMAPTKDGGEVDLRAAPAVPNSMDHVTVALEPSREFAFVTALNTRRRLLLGYLFRASDFPWLQDWESYLRPATMARGLEFSTQPFDLPRREVVRMGTLLDTPAFRWLPAKSRIKTGFIIFYTTAPESLRKVDEVTLSGGKLVVEDRSSGARVELAASVPFPASR